MKKSSTDNRSGNLEDVFRTGFGEAEATPSANLWDRIDKQLDTVEQASVYKKKATFYGRLVLLSALLLLLVGGAWFYQSRKAETAATTEALAQVTQAQSTQPTAPAPATTEDGVAVPGEAKPVPPEPANYPAKPAENTAFPTQTPIQNNATAQPRNNPEITAKAIQTKDQPKAQNQDLLATTSGKASVTQSRKNQNKSAQAKQVSADNAKIRAAAPVALLAGAATTNPAGKLAKSAGLQKQNSSANVPVNTPPVQPETKQAEPAAQPQQSVAPTVTEVQAVPVTTPEAAGNLAVVTSPDSAKQVSTEQPLVVIPATAASDSVATAFTNQAPAMKGGFTFSVLYAGYQFEQGLVVSNNVPGAATPSAAYRKAAQEFNELAKPASSYRAEVRAAYWFHEKLRLETGLGFSRNRALTLSTYEIRSFIFNPGNGNMELATQSSIIEPVLAGAHRDSVEAVSVPEFETSYQYDFLSLPLRVTYQSDTHGWHWFASGGVSAARLLNSRISSTRSTTNSETKHAFRNWNFAGVFSFGLGYQINQRIGLGIGPDLSYSLNSLMSSDKAGIRQANPYTVGVSGGLSYTFR